jgi:hypothetical protein
MNRKERIAISLLSFFILAALALGLAPAARAGSAVLDAEFTLYSGGVMNHSWSWCVWGPDVRFDQGDGTHGLQCASVPGQIVAITGTSTVKSANEVLAFIYCNGQQVWRGEHFQGSLPINVSGLADANIIGPCYVGIQSLGGYSRSGYEIQLVIFYR